LISRKEEKKRERKKKEKKREKSLFIKCSKTGFPQALKNNTWLSNGIKEIETKYIK